MTSIYWCAAQSPPTDGHPSLSLLISIVLRRSTAIGYVQDARRSARPIGLLSQGLGGDWYKQK
jgi:hypothetical protein